MGILDALNSTDPNQQAQLALAAHLLGARSVKGERGGFGQALGGGLLAYQQAMEQGQGNEMKRKMLQLQMDAAEREAKANLPPSAGDMAKFTGMMMGTPERPALPEQQGNNPSAYMPAQAPTPAQPANPMGAYGFAMGSQNPNLQKIGVQGMHQFPQLEATRMEKEENRAWRTQESELARVERARNEQKARDDKAENQAQLRALMGGQMKPHYDAERGLVVDTSTGFGTPVTANGVPVGPKSTNLPKLKPGERWNESNQTIESVPGSDVYIKQSGLHGKDYAAAQGVTTKMDNAIAKINGLLSDKNKDAFNSNFGGYNAYMTQYLPGASSDLRKEIESIKSDLKSAGLEMMRVGGSIGAMTEREWPIVERMVAAIDPVLGEETAREKLGQVVAYMEKIKNNANDAYQTEWGNTQFVKSKNGGDAGGKVMTMADVQATAAKSGKTVDQVMQAAKQRGYTVK